MNPPSVGGAHQHHNAADILDSATSRIGGAVKGAVLGFACGMWPAFCVVIGGLNVSESVMAVGISLCLGGPALACGVWGAFKGLEKLP